MTQMLHRNASAASLSFVRSLVLVLLLGMTLGIDLSVYPELPLSDLPRRGVALLLPESVWQRLMTNLSILVVFKFAVITSLLCALAGIVRTPALVAASLVVTLEQCMTRAIGGDFHYSVVPLFALYTLTLFELASPRKRTDQPAGADAFAPIAVITLILALSYALIAIRRITHGGPSLFFSESLGLWFLSRGFAGFWNVPGTAWVESLVTHPELLLAFQIGFVVTTIIELSSPLVLVIRWIRPIVIAGLLAFHILTVVSMNIMFWPNLLLLVLFAGFERWVEPRPAAGSQVPIVYFDGVCGLCNRFVDVVMRWDKTAVLRFAPIQGVTASGRLGERDNDPEKWSIVYEDETRVYERSEAVLRILMRLGWPFLLAGVLLMVPGFIRDAVYRSVARNRYRWFGKRDTCRLPTPAERARFLD